jgi:CheY-like chemotaxis protein
LNALVPDTIEALFGKAAAKNLKISFELAPGTPTLLKTDPFRLRQVLFNLMDNAIDRAGEGEILVKAGKADGSAKIRFEIVARDGGIPKELLPQIFSMPSMENAPNLSAARKGSGLPLALSKMLVELLGGSIGVRNDEEGRSVFHFEIPAREMDDYLYSSKEPARKPPRSGATAILYEPETVDLLIVSSYLKRLGCLVGEAFSTEMLAEQLQRLACAVVVFDMQPDEPQALDSFKKLRKLKKGDGKSGVLSLAIVADADGELARRCLQIGMDGVVRRPANFTQFVDEIAPWLEKLDSSGSGSLAGVLASGSNGASPAESLELRLLMEHVLDKKQLASVCADDVQILDGVLELSPKEFEHLALKLGEAVAGNDMKNAALVAHSLKGASANIGGRRLSLLCKEVEMEAKAGRVEEAKDGLVRIEAEIKEFFAAVKAYRDALT